MEKYTFNMRIIHWVMSILMLTLLAVGLWMTALPEEYPGKYDVIYPMHKSFGMIVMILIALRISVRLRSHVPKLPASITKFDQKLSAATIGLLYVCMLLMPISGYFMSTFGAHPVAIFGLLVPSIVNPDPVYGKLFKEIHGIVGFTVIGLIVLHLAGTLKHYFVEKVNLLNRMI